MVKVPGFEHGRFFIWAKRLEQGLFASPLAPGQKSLSLSRTALSALLDGIDITTASRSARGITAYRRPQPAALRSTVWRCVKSRPADDAQCTRSGVKLNHSFSVTTQDGLLVWISSERQSPRCSS